MKITKEQAISMGFKSDPTLENYYLNPNNFRSPQFMYYTSRRAVYFKTIGTPLDADMKEVHPKILFLLGLRL